MNQQDMVEIANQTCRAIDELLEIAALRQGQILVIGCSTSEVRGEKIGSAGSDEIAKTLIDAIVKASAAKKVILAIQCCEHLNRALVMERSAAEQYRLDEVSVVPVPKAGGALAAQAMHCFDDPVVVETVVAHAGLDIGGTLIGMHLKPVAVPVRLAVKQIGQAFVTAARTRPKLIGGNRAVYDKGNIII